MKETSLPTNYMILLSSLNVFILHTNDSDSTSVISRSLFSRISEICSVDMTLLDAKRGFELISF